MSIEWRKPELVCIKTQDLLCKVKAKATSVPTCTSAYLEEHACNQLSVENTWGEGGAFDPECSILTECFETGPLLGCFDNGYCNITYLLR